MNPNNNEEREFEIGEEGREGRFVERRPIISLATLAVCAFAVIAALAAWQSAIYRIENKKLREASQELLRVYYHNIEVANNFQLAASNNQASAEYWAGKYANLTNRIMKHQMRGADNAMEVK